MSQQDENTSDPDFIVDDIDISDPEATPGWDGVQGPQLPAGDYEVEVIGAAMKDTKTGDGRQLVLDLQVKQEGEQYDAKFKHWITMPSSSHKDGGMGAKKRIAHVVRDTLEAPLHPQTGGFAGKDLIGRRMVVTITHSASTFFDAATNQDVTKTRMNIQAERKVGDVTAPADAKPAPTKPAAAQPAAKPGAQPAAARRPAASPPAARRG